MSRRLPLAGCIVALAVVAVAQMGDSLGLPDAAASALDTEIARNQTELDRTRTQIEQVRGQLEQLGSQERVALGKIDAYADQIALTQRYVRQLDAQSQARRREVASVAVQVERTSARISQRKRDLGARLVSIYKHGRTLPLEALLSTRSLPQMYRKLVYLRWIARADRRLAGELAALTLQLDQQRQRVLAAQDEIRRLRDESASQQAALDAAQRQERAMLAALRVQSAARESVRAGLQAAADRLSDLVADLERRRANLPAASDSFLSARGRLPWPLRGTVIAGFGTLTHPKYGTKTTSLGIDIKAEPGAMVKAVASGRVAYADQFMGYGNLIILDHGAGFYTLYGNLDELLVAVGRDVAAGKTLGTARDHVHFEVRRDGKPVDPMNWLSR
jgi:septal ring factor EnvC (AmiA/AmiB activator)